MTALGFITEDRSDVLVIAFTDKRNRERSLVFVDVDSLSIIGSLRQAAHPHVKNIVQLAYESMTVVTTSADTAVVWTYMGSFDINHRLKDPVDVVKIHARYRPQSNSELIVQTAVSGDTLSVLTRSGPIYVLSFPDLLPVTQLDLPNTTIRSISVFEDLMVVLGSAFGKSVVDIIAMREQPESVARFTAEDKRILSVSLYDEETIVALTDDGYVSVVDMVSNQLIGSTSRLSKITACDFAASHDKLVLFGNKCGDFEVFQMRQLVEQSCPVSRKVFFFDPHHDHSAAREELGSGFAMFECPGSMQERIRQYTVWLELPLNEQAYAFLVQSPELPGFCDTWTRRLHDLGFSGSRLKRLSQVLGLLTAWNETFIDNQNLPYLVFPFVKLFAKSDLHFTTELVIWFLCNVSRSESQELGATLLYRQDPELADHIERLVSPSSLPDWLEDHFGSSFLTESLDGPSWLRLMDMLVFWVRHNRTRCPSQLGVRIISNFPRLFRAEIILLKSPSDLLEWVSQPRSLQQKDIESLFEDQDLIPSPLPTVRLSAKGTRYPDLPL